MANGNPNWVKGVSANPGGKGKGVWSKKTEEYLKVKTLAAGSYEKVFNVLLEKALGGEAWAQQLYYKEFIPKKAKELTAMVQHEDNTVEGQIKALTEALVKFDELTQEEIVERLKALTALRLRDSIEENTSIMKDTRDSLMDKIDKLDELIDIKQVQANLKKEKSAEKQREILRLSFGGEER